MKARHLHGNAKDLTGQHFGRLTAVEPTAERSGTNVLWLCYCECGNRTLVRANCLTSGKTRSCGCLGRELSRARFLEGIQQMGWETSTIHGMSYTLEYKAEQARQRRARKRGATVGKNLRPEDIARRMDDLGGRCIYCGGPFEHVDHLIPLSRGGAHAIQNLVPSCAHCNISKGDRYLGSEWWPWENSYG